MSERVSGAFLISGGIELYIPHLRDLCVSGSRRNGEQMILFVFLGLGLILGLGSCLFHGKK